MAGARVIHPNVHLGPGAELDDYVILGRPPRGRKSGELELVIGPNAVIRAFTTIYAGSVIGASFQTGHGASIREDNVIGDGTSVGTNAVLEFGNRIGKGCRIHSLSFLEMTTLGDNVFVGPRTTFTDDPHPMGCPRYKECKGGAIVEDLVKIGAGAVILPGVRIGRGALIGAGSVVAHDVPAGMVVAGNPARVIKRVDELTCPPGFFERPYIWEPYVTPAGVVPMEQTGDPANPVAVPSREQAGDPSNPVVVPSREQAGDPANPVAVPSREQAGDRDRAVRRRER